MDLISKLRGVLKLNIILFPIVIFMLFGLNAIAAPRVQSPKGDNFVVVIDPGHGGDNDGTEGHLKGTYLEKQMTLITAQALYDELSKYDNVTVYMTRTNDASLSLKQRAEYAASVNADMLFSIHYNASVEHGLFGSEVWVPSDTPYHAYGYQFAMEELSAFNDKGLFIRGAKTKLNNDGENYYGIIRESTALGVPSVIIEHCHVDNETDIGYCDSDDDLRTFGVLDATCIAKYFGLRSESLGVDYSGHAASELYAADANSKNSFVFNPFTDPDVCEISLGAIDYDTGEVEIEITAADYDDILIYFDYSVDGGETYTTRLPMPGYDYFDRTVADSFKYTVSVPSGTTPRIIFRVYNIFDRMTESNVLELADAFIYGESDASSPDGANSQDKTREEIIADAKKPKNMREVVEKELPGTISFAPNGEPIEEDEGFSVKDFLVLVLAIVFLIFVTAFFIQLVSYNKRKKKKRARRYKYDYDEYDREHYHY